MTLTTREKVHARSSGIQGPLVLVVAIATAAVMALGVVVAWEIERSGARQLHMQQASSRFGAPAGDLGGIELSIIAPGVGAGAALDARVPAAAPAPSSEAAAQRLRAYGWVDRERGRVHIPLERAMQLYLARERAAGVGPGEKGRPPADGAPSRASRGSP